MHLQSSAKQRTLGCVIPPLAAGVISRNLGIILSRSSVHRSTKEFQFARERLEENELGCLHVYGIERDSEGVAWEIRLRPLLLLLLLLSLQSMGKIL